MTSHRSGETEDAFIADLAVGLATGQIKTGAPCRRVDIAVAAAAVAAVFAAGAVAVLLSGSALVTVARMAYSVVVCLLVRVLCSACQLHPCSLNVLIYSVIYVRPTDCLTSQPTSYAHHMPVNLLLI